LIQILMKKIDKKKDIGNLKHIAFIMDGNGRWAKKRGLPRNVGHKFGYEKMKVVLKRCCELGVPVVSVYAFSTENWNRSKEEVDAIFGIVRDNLVADTPLFQEWNVKISTMGDTSKFPKDLQDALSDIKKSTESNTGTILNLCINYGGRADVCYAVNQVLAKKLAKVTEEELGKHLYGANLPDPDLIVRTSGEQRMSNFLIWQGAYAELLFLKQNWPSMSPKLVDSCITKFKKRNRRFGRVK